VVAKWIPREQVERALAQTGKVSRRQRDLPGQVVVYYVIALALFMQVSYREVLRCLLEGLEWLAGVGTRLKVAGNSGISQARSRIGVEWGRPCPGIRAPACGSKHAHMAPLRVGARVNR